MFTSCETDKSLDFKYFINLALMNKLPWDSLVFVLKDLTTTLEKSNEVIEVLVQELQKLQIDLQNSSNQTENSAKQIETKTIVNSGKSNSEDESIVSQAERSYDLQATDSEYEEKVNSFEEYTNFSSEKNLEDEVNEMNSVIISESNKELSDKYDQEDFYENFDGPETKLDRLASRFYEFIGDSDDVANETSKVLPVDIEEKVNYALKPNKTKKNETCSSEMEHRNKSEEELTPTRRNQYQCKICKKIIFQFQ